MANCIMCPECGAEWVDDYDMCSNCGHVNMPLDDIYEITTESKEVFYESVIRKCQGVLTDYLKPEGTTSDEAVNRLLAILDDKDLVSLMNDNDTTFDISMLEKLTIVKVESNE